MPNIQTIEKPANVLNLSNVEITHFVKPTQILGRYIANSILKDGFYFSTEDEKLKELWEKFKHDNNFTNLIWNICNDCSVMNSDIYTINRTKNNNLLLLKVANSGLNDFAFDSINPNIAVCDVNYATAGGGSITVRRIYTTEETITEGFNEMTMEKIKLHGKELKLSDDLKIKAHDRHNLGVCPIVIFYNLPYTQERQAQTSKLISFGNTALNNFSYDFLKFNFQKDSAYCEDLATLINQAYITMYKKMIYCRPRVIYTGANAAEFYGNGGTNALKAQLQDSDFIINIENNAEQLQVINQDTKLTDIQESIDNLWNDFFTFSGYSFYRVLTGAQKSANEIKQSMLQTIITNKIKRRNFEDSIKNLLWKCIKFWILNGQLEDKEYKWEFGINDLSEESETVLVDSLIKAVNSSLLGIDQAVSRYQNITLEKAQEKLEQIKTLNEKYLVKEEKELKESNETQAMNNQNASK